MRLTQLFVNRPTLVTVALALIALLGSFALATLVVQQFPNIDFPTVTVSVSYPGASPTELRDSVVRPIEDAIAGAPDLDHINTSIQQNQATISATFSLDSVQTTDLVAVQDRVQAAQAALPSDLPAPTVRTFDPSQANVVTLSLTSASLNVADLSAIITNNIVPALEQVDGVSNVNAGGVVTPAIEVTVDPYKLSSSGFALNDIVSSIQANNVRAPGGIAYSAARETSIDVRGDVQTPQDVAQLLLTGSTAVNHGATSPSGTSTAKFTGSTNTSSTANHALDLASSVSNAPAASTGATNPFSTSPRYVTIGDVAAVTSGYEPKRVYSYVGGRPAITLSVAKASGASEITASDAVLAALPAIEAQYPQIHFDIVNVQADFTKQQLSSVLQSLIEGIIFTGIVMLFFLRSWRNALVVLVAIPASLLVTCSAMKMLNFTLDMVSLLAMNLIIGILVDDSIVVLENVERHFEDGEAPRTAAILGRSEIASAAVVITLVDVVVFLPIAFLPGQTGKWLGEFGIVVTIATLTSLLVSFTITPSLAGNWALFSKWSPPRIIDRFLDGFARLRTWYVEKALAWALDHRAIVVAVSAISTAAAISLIPLGLIGFEQIPTVDRGQIFVQVQFPTGTPLTITDKAIRAVSDAYTEKFGDEIQRITSTAGSYQAGFGGSINLGSNGQLQVFLTTNHKTPTADMAKKMTGLGGRVANGAKVIAIPATGTRGGNSQPIDFTVSTTRGDPLSYAQQVLAVLQDTPGAANANSSAIQMTPQINIEFNRDRARALDLDIGAAASAVRAAFGGTLATQFDTTKGTMYVQVLYPMSAQTSLATLKAITMRTRGGQLVHLGDVAILQNSPAQALLTRVNRETVIHVSANLAPGAALSTVTSDALARVKALHFPDFVIVGTAAGGSQQGLRQQTSGITAALPLSLILVFLLMVALYDAYRAPFVILFAVPVALIGALGALALAGQSLNLFSSIGVIMLVGLVSKNGILLVDFAHLKVLAGMDKRTAITRAARERFRPIVMTTCSMIAGMLPLALALDPGSAAKRSLGTVVIGGLSSSLVLTLVLVPVMYMWIAPGPPKGARAGARLGDRRDPAFAGERA